MVRKGLAFGTVALGALLLVGTAVSVASAPIKPDLMSTYDLSQLGLDLRPLDGASSARTAPTLPEEAALGKATEVVGNLGSPQAFHVLAKTSADSAPQPVWLFVYPEGNPDMLPAGPVNDDGSRPQLFTTYTGVMIDDVTGEVVQLFQGGHQ